MTYDDIIYTADDTEQIRALKREIHSLRAQLAAQEGKTQRLSGGSLLRSEDIDLYPGEQHDFVLSILEQVKSRCPVDSRPYDILESLLACNKPVGRGREILSELNRIFRKGDPSSDADISDLRAMGFTYVQSRKHPKLRFHDKYMFVLPSTPGDRCGGALNGLKEVSKCIAVGQKV